MDRRVIRPFSRSKLFHNHYPSRRADGEVHRVSLNRAGSNSYALSYKQSQQLAQADAIRTEWGYRNAIIGLIEHSLTSSNI